MQTELLTPVGVYIITYKRPQNIEPILKNLEESTKAPLDIYFVIEKDDQPTIDKLVDLNKNYIFNHYEHSALGACNTCFEVFRHRYFFLTPDDVIFGKDWLEHLLNHVEKFPVVGTNDLHQELVLQKKHATSFLIDREYIEKESGSFNTTGVIFNPIYKHNYADLEFIGTAIARGKFTPCLESIVEHRFRSPDQYDETFYKTRKEEPKDRALYHSRRYLWEECVGYRDYMKGL